QQDFLGADPPFLKPALKFFLHGAEAVHFRNHVHGHEADIVPVHRVARTGISEANPKLHWRLVAGWSEESILRPGTKSAGPLRDRRPGDGWHRERDYSSEGASSSPPVSSPAATSSPSSDSARFSADGATIVAMVKSRSVIALSEPSGSVTLLMWIASPTSRPVTSIWISAGILSASQTSSRSWRTT